MRFLLPQGRPLGGVFGFLRKDRIKIREGLWGRSFDSHLRNPRETLAGAQLLWSTVGF